MFAHLTQQDKLAFFDLLDEYFESRPHLRATSPPTSAMTASSSSRTLPPVARTSSSSVSRTAAPTLPSPSAAEPDRSFQQNTSAALSHLASTNPGLTSKLISSGIRSGASNAKGGLGKLAQNQQVSDALGKVGARGLAMNAGAQREQDNTPASSAPAQAQGKKSGVSGLVQSKTFGHVDTSSKMGAFTSMWKDPQKVKEPSANTYIPPTFQQKQNLPPPPRRGVSQPEPEPEPEEDFGAEGQAEVVYDYASAVSLAAGRSLLAGGRAHATQDAGDLPVQKNQIVNVLEKTSSDWWTCEDGDGRKGLVPANYLKEI
ncbi:hypothetical protein P7C73_g3899, partial [Tremellales sp. Uapishka_1]